jgi:hypothetical protein
MLDLTIDTSIVANTNEVATVANANASEFGLTAADYLKTLILFRKTWENGSLQKSNEELYALLGRCLRVYELMAQDTEEGATLRKGLEDYVKQANMKFDGNTHTVTKIVRVVFDNDRRRYSQYGLVLLAALRKGVQHGQLAEFIRAEGGIDKVRAAGAHKGEKMEDKAKKVWAAVKAKALATVSNEELARASDLANIGKRVVLLATQRANGVYEIHAVVKDANAVDAAYASQLATVAKAAANETAETQAAVQAETLDESRKKLVEAMLC